MFKTLFVILFIFIFLIYFKSSKENFLINDRFNIKFNQNNEILFLNKDLINIKKSLSETVFKKNDHLFYSNEVIYSTSNNNGFIFKPNKNIKNIYIGLSNINNDNKESMIDNNLLDFSFNLLGNNFLKINEMEEIDGNKQYYDQNLDYCIDENLERCMSSNSSFRYDSNDYLSITIHNNQINYLIVKVNKNKLSGLLIHKSKKIPTFPLSICIINKENDNILEKYYYTNTDTEISDDLKWNVEFLTKNTYDKLSLPPSMELNFPSESESPIESQDIEIPTYERGIRILYDNFFIEKNNLILMPTIYNINQNLLNRIHSLKISIKIDSKDDNRHFIFDIKNGFNNKKFILGNENKLMLKNNKSIEKIKVNLSNYINIFSNKTLLCNVTLRRSEFNTDDLNYISNEIRILDFL